MIRSYIILLLLLFSISSSFAQRMSHRIYGPDDGFPAFEYTSLALDTAGFPWFFSADYMSTFDGYELQQVKLDTTPLKSFPRRTIFNSHNDFLLLSNNYKLFRKPAGQLTIEKMQFDETLDESSYFFKYRDTVFLLSRPNDIYYYKRSKNTFTRDTSSVFNQYLENHPKGIRRIYTDSTNALIVSFVSEHEERLSLIRNNSVVSEYIVAATDQYDLFYRHVFLADFKANGFFVLKEQERIKIELPEIISTKQDLWRRSMQGPNGGHYLGTSDANLRKKIHWIRLDSTLNSQYIGSTQRTTGPSLAHDSNGHFWLASHNGLIKYNTNILHLPSEDPNMVAAPHAFVEDDNGIIWIAGYYNEISWFDNQIHRSKAGSYAVLPGAFRMNDGRLWFNDENSVVLYDGKNFHNYRFYENAQQITSSGYIVEKLRDETLAVGMSNYGLGLVENIEKGKIHVRTYGKSKGMQLRNVLAIKEDKLGRVWLGRSSKGVALFDRQRDSIVTFELTAENPHSFGAMSIERDSNDNLWFGANDGLYFLEDPSNIGFSDTTFFDKTKKVILPNGDASLCTFVKQVDGFIVVGNTTAVSFIPLNKWYSNRSNCPIYQLYYGEDLEGDGSEQNMIFQDSKGYVWIGSQKGASRIDLRHFEFDSTRNTIRIYSVMSGTRQLSAGIGESIRVPTDLRSLSISFGPENNVSLLRNVFFQYLLTNTRGDTILEKHFDQEGRIQLPYISPGSYHLQISASKHGLLMDTKQLTIHAPYAFFENPWTQTGLLFVFFGGLSFFIIYRSVQNRKILAKDLKLSKISQEKDQLQLQSIISSFNPHFINNSLHWAQSRYRKDEELVNVIGSLSENIGYIFTNTRKGIAVHSLTDEMKLVRNYVSIHQIRFDSSFEFNEPSPEKMGKYRDFQIPIMQLQIHVENSIEHGLRNRIESSFVRISIEEDDSYVEFIVTDDGCGRERAKILESHGTQTGTKMLKALHGLFNQLDENKLPIITQYQDNIYTDPAGNRYGTSVIIKIPKHFTYELEKI